MCLKNYCGGRTRKSLLIPKILKYLNPEKLSEIMSICRSESGLTEGPISDPRNLLLDATFNRHNQFFAESVLRIFENQLQETEDLVGGFPGVERRQTVLLSSDRFSVIEDYAHHPSEIAILIKAVKNKFPSSELAVVFQPHRYSRTKALNKDFTESFSEVDSLYLLPVYSAFEAECEVE